MRNTFFQTLAVLAERDARIVLLTGDLGYKAIEPFADRYPERFFNVGVAEQNMVGLATGMAEAGYVPFTYSIVPFALLRPYEFIRNGPVLHQLPVRIVGVGGGVEYGHNGPSHYGLEDIAVTRVQPGLTVVAPADAQQARTALLDTWHLPGPIYYRLGKDDRAEVRGLDGRFALGRAQQIREGADLLLVTMGSIAPEVVAAADLLAAQGVRCTLAVVASVSPPPADDLLALLRRFPLVISVENHYLNGGLGSLLAELIAEHGIATRLLRRGMHAMLDGRSGSQEYLHRIHGISADAVASAALHALRAAA